MEVIPLKFDATFSLEEELLEKESSSNKIYKSVNYVIFSWNFVMRTQLTTNKFVFGINPN